MCMRLLEEAGSREGVVSLLEHATSVLDEKDDVLVSGCGLVWYGCGLMCIFQCMKTSCIKYSTVKNFRYATTCISTMYSLIDFHAF